MLIGNELINHFLAVGPFLKEIFGKDIVVWVSNKDIVLGYFKGFNFDAPSDDILHEGDPMLTAMDQRRQLNLYIDEKMFGIPFKEIDTPIFDDRQNVIGCITVGITLDHETKVASAANEINDAVITLNATIGEVTFEAKNIEKYEQQLREKMDSVNKLTEEISKVLAAFTRKVTVQTKLLGLNAAIEATQAGKYGVGFGVVADEIAHLSDESTEITKHLETLITQINKANKEMLSSYVSVNEASGKQIILCDNTLAQIQELQSTSDLLKAVSKEL